MSPIAEPAFPSPQRSAPVLPSPAFRLRRALEFGFAALRPSRARSKGKIKAKATTTRAAVKPCISNPGADDNQISPKFSPHPLFIPKPSLTRPTSAYWSINFIQEGTSARRRELASPTVQPLLCREEFVGMWKAGLEPTTEEHSAVDMLSGSLGTPSFASRISCSLLAADIWRPSSWTSFASSNDRSSSFASPATSQSHYRPPPTHSHREAVNAHESTRSSARRRSGSVHDAVEQETRRESEFRGGDMSNEIGRAVGHRRRALFWIAEDLQSDSEDESEGDDLSDARSISESVSDPEYDEDDEDDLGGEEDSVYLDEDPTGSGIRSSSVEASSSTLDFLHASLSLEDSSTTIPGRSYRRGSPPGLNQPRRGRSFCRTGTHIRPSVIALSSLVPIDLDD